MYLETENEFTEVSSDEKLWRYVIKRGILDACAIFEDSKPYRNKESFIEECKDWFNTDDFEIVCQLANLDEDFVKKIYKNVDHSYTFNNMRSSLLSSLIDKLLERAY